MVSAQQKSNRVDLVCDSGMEFIWFLEDAYERKDMNKFLSSVAPDFRKDFIGFKKQLEKTILKYASIELYIHFLYKSQDLEEDVFSYNISWVKRFKKQKDRYWHREAGKAKIVLKKCRDRKYPFFLFYDIDGDNPFN